MVLVSQHELKQLEGLLSTRQAKESELYTEKQQQKKEESDMNSHLLVPNSSCVYLLVSEKARHEAGL